MYIKWVKILTDTCKLSAENLQRCTKYMKGISTEYQKSNSEVEIKECNAHCRPSHKNFWSILLKYLDSLKVQGLAPKVWK